MPAPPSSAARRSTARCAGSARRRQRAPAPARHVRAARALRRMLTSVYETLRAAGRELGAGARRRYAARERIEAFRGGGPVPRGGRARHRAQRGNAEQALLWSPRALPERIVDLGALAAAASARRRTRRRGAVERAALEELAARDRDLLQELLRRFADEYAEAKRHESAVDFEDLQLAAAISSSDAAVREAESMRFRELMVDEFQDTNASSASWSTCSRGPRRSASSSATSSSRSTASGTPTSACSGSGAAAGTLLALRRNYRSRPEVLAAVNHLFHEEFGDGLPATRRLRRVPGSRLRAPRRACSSPTSRPATTASTGGGLRRATSRGACASSSTTGARPGRDRPALRCRHRRGVVRGEELRRLDLPTYRATGRGYFAQQQVADLLAYLRLLQNRHDDRALATVLASPFVGVSNDALVLAAPARGAPAAFTRSSGRCPRASGPRTCGCCSARSGSGTNASSRRRGASRWRRSSSSSSSTTTTSRCSRWTDGAALREPPQARAPARSYEALRGRDLDGFVRFVAARTRSARASWRRCRGGGRRRRPAAHDPRRQGARVQGRDRRRRGRDTGRPADPDEIVAPSDGRFGFKVVIPREGVARPSSTTRRCATPAPSSRPSGCASTTSR